MVIENLVRAFGVLPGIGPKTAEKLVYALLKKPSEFKEVFANDIRASKDMQRCASCFTFTPGNLCDLCSDPSRDRTSICVVADPQDIQVMEKTKKFTGRYHVLGGLISPLEGVAQKQLTIDALIGRVKNENSREVILALDQTNQGETTTLLIAKALKQFPVKISVLARGLPLGSDIEYADDTTLGSAFEGRKEI